MSRLLYRPIIGAIVLLLGWWRQPSIEADDTDDSVRVGCLLSPASWDGGDCSLGGLAFALLARATTGTLGDEPAARCAHEQLAKAIRHSGGRPN